MAELSQAQTQIIEDIVKSYVSRIEIAQRLSRNLSDLLSSEKLAPLVHSMKSRAKDPASLGDKLKRKMAKANTDGKEFDISADNLYEKINDLAGVRLLHLHTSQFPVINAFVLELLNDEGYKVIEGPVARTWDDEYKAAFAKMSVATVPSERMYTSVHYVVDAGAGTKRTAEIQVRTLAEELWGEVDHTINYPRPCGIPSCEEQIKVLARVTSSCTRLVDSIFFTRDAEEEKRNRKAS